MKLLVTGGAGFIGGNFIHYWLKKYPKDKIINKLTYAGNLASLKDVENHPGYKFVKGDIGDGKLVNRLMKGVDLVVHFAAESHVDRSILGPQVFVKTNVLGTQVLLEAAVKAGVERFHLPEKLIPLAITNLMKGKKVPVYGDGKQVRDWLYVEDHCRAIDLVVRDKGSVGETYCVGGLTKDIPIQ